MTGDLNAECGVRNAESSSVGEMSYRALFVIIRQFRTPHFAFRNQRGFSLLELMIAMFILIILLSIAVPTYQRTMRQARETVLKENLWMMRRAIDQYTSDKGKLPKSIDDLVEARYLHERPIDPVMNSTEWQEIMGEDPNSQDAEQGLKDVKTTADGNDSEDKPFSEY